MATVINDQTTRSIASDDRFFLISSFVMAATVVAGFSLQLAMGRSSFAVPLLVHVHAIVFMGWVAIYVTQTYLAATGARGLHRQLGWIGAVWVAAMVVLGTTATLVMVRRGATPFFFQPAYFVIMNPLAVITFAGLTWAAIVKRRETLWHRRLHFCGMTILLGPAFGRLLPMPLLIPWASYAVFAAILIFPLAGIFADLRRRGRVHPAWWWGLGTIVMMQLAIDAIVYSPAGAAFHHAVVAGGPGEAQAPYDFPPPPAGPLITGR